MHLFINEVGDTDMGHYLIGELYFLIEVYDTAEFHFNKSLLLNPKDSLSLYYLGRCYFAKEDYISAAKYFKKSIKITPDDPNTHYNLALAYNALGKNREVKKQMNIIYMLDQSLYNELAIILEKN
jgi:tetratricopeptide (TPR) repeat protein